MLLPHNQRPRRIGLLVSHQRAYLAELMLRAKCGSNDVDRQIGMIQTELENPLIELASRLQEDSMTETRRHSIAEQKVAIVRRRLLEQVPVSDLCDEYGVQPSVLYRWQQQLFEKGAAAFASVEGRKRYGGPEDQGPRREARTQERSAWNAAFSPS
jgi:transposase-like protein